MAGIAMVVLVTLLGVGLVIVLKGYLASPAATQAGGGTGSGSGSGGAGALSGPRAGGSTVSRGQFAPHESPTFESAQKAITNREFEKAEAILRRFMEENADATTDVAVNLAMGEALLGREDFQGAYRQYERVIALEGKNVAPSLHFQAGTIASKAGMLDRAEEHYSMAQTADPARAEYPLYLAMVQLRRGETEPGIASLLRTIKLNPELAEAWGTLAEVYFRDNKLEIAMPNVQRARELQPGVARWRIVEAKILKRQAKPGEALNILAAMESADRERPEAFTLMAECYGMLSLPGEAAALFEGAAAREPANAEYHYQAAVWHRRAGNAEGALASAKTAAMMGHEGAKELVGAIAAAETK